MYFNQFLRNLNARSLELEINIVDNKKAKIKMVIDPNNTIALMMARKYKSTFKILNFPKVNKTFLLEVKDQIS